MKKLNWLAPCVLIFVVVMWAGYVKLSFWENPAILLESTMWKIPSFIVTFLIFFQMVTKTEWFPVLGKEGSTGLSGVAMAILNYMVVAMSSLIIFIAFITFDIYISYYFIFYVMLFFVSIFGKYFFTKNN